MFLSGFLKKFDELPARDVLGNVADPTGWIEDQTGTASGESRQARQKAKVKMLAGSRMR